MTENDCGRWMKIWGVLQWYLHRLCLDCILSVVLPALRNISHRFLANDNRLTIPWREELFEDNEILPEVEVCQE